MDCRCKGIHRCEIYPASIDLYANKLPPTLDTLLNGTDDTGYRPKGASDTGYRRKSYRVHGISPRMYRLFFSCSFFVLCSFWFFGILFGRTSLWTCGQRYAPAPTHTPAPTPAHTTLSVVSRTVSGFEGNPSATSSRVAGSATRSSAEAGSAASSGPGSDNPVDGSEPAVLQPPNRAETTISGGGNRRITVTLEQLVSGRRKVTAWCWRFVSRFTRLSTIKMFCVCSIKLMGLPAITS